ncbi:hypothetical protein ASPZODRAFT_130505 [Penicilliopsis zonata CBS 506.65]|uniref:Mitochondrial fusion protein n=1 Tax=Penicilliopsis zonata CBS 506.65 TaxID=1073090 RepID=A0A1L9SN50_9EURO|nr:hypothetical protein ASPZODRAFT_130505 [Penicilliopsis zonata CBS 506.65]OJJ48467.1 hypothetical protein ASPZODRAFT_130505 [Penicilliopsis zonata CBS 506.65]
MNSSRDGPNPLRPYYVPPPIGLSTGSVAHVSPAATDGPASAQVFGGSARNLLSDLDYSDYLDPSPSVSEWLRDVVDKALWRYMSALTAQPFDVAKTILQAYVVPSAEEEGQWARDDRRRSIPQPGKNSYREDGEDEDENSLSSDDESNYFTSAAPTTASPKTPKSQRHRHITDRSGYIPGPPSSAKHALTIKNPSSLMEVLSQLWSTSGPTAPWKATNTTFIYSLLLPTLNTFIRSLLSAIVGLPEEDIASSMTADILTVASPVATLILSFISTSLTAIILSPIDTARTFLILTSATHGPRSLLRAIRLIPTPNHTIPPHLVPITVLHSSLPSLITTSAPLFLKSYLSIDPVLHPSMWNLCSCLSSGLELAVRFPLETVLRRAQISTFTSPGLQQQHTASASSSTDMAVGDIETIVPTPRSYRGIVSTMWGIVHEEGARAAPSENERARELLGKSVSKHDQQRRPRGQGIQGLYRGWRIGMWGVAGIWGASLLGSAGGADEDLRSSGRF